MTGRYKVKWISSTHDTSVEEALNSMPFGYQLWQLIELSSGGALIVMSYMPEEFELTDDEESEDWQDGWETGYNNGYYDGHNDHARGVPLEED